jgi:ABC-type nitrate/sulfonate/bicarbonate transport system substrate-binding protein
MGQSMHRKRRLLKFLFIFLVCFIFPHHNLFADEMPIRIGWQTSWATQGQIAVILKKTNILKLNGLVGDFKGFSYGGPLNEGALSGEVDVIFTADQPACMLLAKGAKWKIVGRLIYNRVATIAPYNSSIQSIAGLKGKVVGIPFGAAAHRETLRALKNSGLDLSQDVQIKNIGIYEQMNVIQAGDDRQWGNFAAFSTWDPSLAELEHMQKAKVLDYGLVTSVIVMSEDFLNKHPDAAVNFLKAYITAFYHYSQNQKQANLWFKKESKLDFDLEVLDLAASVEPNLKIKTLDEVDIGLSDEDIEVIQSGADFIYDQKLTDKQIKDIRGYLDLSFLQKAENELRAENDNYLSNIRMLNE